MEEREFESDYISISDILYALKKRWYVILVTALLFIAAAAGYFFVLSQPTYEGSVKIFASNNEKVQNNYSDLEMESYYNMMATYIAIIQSEDFMDTIINKTGVDETPKSLVNSVEFITTENTPILEIKYASKDEEMAEDVVSTITREFEDKVTEVVLNTYTKVIDTVKVKDISPNKVQMIIIAALLGMIVGSGLAILMNSLDDTIVRIEDLEKACNIPLLGELPLEATTSKSTVKKNKRARRNRRRNRNRNSEVVEGSNVYS